MTARGFRAVLPMVFWGLCIYFVSDGVLYENVRFRASKTSNATRTSLLGFCCGTSGFTKKKKDVRQSILEILRAGGRRKVRETHPCLLATAQPFKSNSREEVLKQGCTLSFFLITACVDSLALTALKAMTCFHKSCGSGAP